MPAAATAGARLRRGLLWAGFAAFILFLYGPTATIMVLSFQGPDGGLTFPMRGASLHWFGSLFAAQAVGDIWSAVARSVTLALMVMVATVLISLLAGLAFRRRFRFSSTLLTLTLVSLIVPSILVSLGVGLVFSQSGLDAEWWNAAFGAQLTWTVPFGVLIMFAVFNRFDRRWEEAALDLGASSWQRFAAVVLPIILPSVIGIALFGLTLSWDEFARTLLTSGSDNTLPLEIYGMTTTVTTPVLYALGASTTALSFVVIALALGAIALLRRRAPPS